MAPPFRPKQNRPAGGRPGSTRRTGGPPPHRPGEIDEAVLYGVHPVVEALRNPQRRHRRLLATENALRRLQELVSTLPLEPEIVRPSEIDRLLTPDSVHQGLYLVCDPLPSPDLDSLPDDAVVLALDQITDPHNVGAILRSAAAFGAAAVIVTIRHSPAATGVLVSFYLLLYRFSLLLPPRPLCDSRPFTPTHTSNTRVVMGEGLITTKAHPQI